MSVLGNHLAEGNGFQYSASQIESFHILIKSIRKGGFSGKDSKGDLQRL